MIVDERSPRYLDLQVNGYAGVDFNQDDLTADAFHAACARLRADGVSCLATIISDDLDAMCGRLRRIVTLREADPLAAEVVRGVHIEGPFISGVDGFRGAHPRDAVRDAIPDEMERLLDAAGGLARIVTLAPERDAGCRVTRLLASRGIVVSAGHTDASVEQLLAAVDAGLSMCTHLGNGCPMQLHRHDNIVQRMLSLAGRVWVSFIADGVHVPFVALGNYLRLVGPDRAIVVTDAMAAAGCGPGRFALGRWRVTIGDDLVARAPDGTHLVGSAATMAHVEALMRRELRLADDELQRLTSDNPRRVLGV
jgi:N-acetylglucosamine-6-phosphate deacetylase